MTYKRLYFSLEFWIALGRGKISARLQYSVVDEVRNLFEFSWSPVDAYFPVSSLAAVLRFQRYLRVQQFSSIAVGFLEFDYAGVIFPVLTFGFAIFV